MAGPQSFLLTRGRDTVLSPPLFAGGRRASPRRVNGQG